VADVLLVIDVQRELVEALPSKRASELLTVLAGLIERARSSGVPVVYVRHDGDEQELTPGSDGWQIVDAIAPRANETVVAKRFRDAFRETNLADVLAGLGADHVVVCGMQTEFCVDATVREAERRGYRVTLVADGHATFAAEGATEEQIRDQVHRVARYEVAAIVPAADVRL
jgi:nicotinamidase-related amidase